MFDFRVFILHSHVLLTSLSRAMRRGNQSAIPHVLLLTETLRVISKRIPRRLVWAEEDWRFRVVAAKNSLRVVLYQKSAFMLYGLFMEKLHSNGSCDLRCSPPAFLCLSRPTEAGD